MNRFGKALFTILFLGLALAFPLAQARAVPTLPSSFYGTVTVNGANIPDGTVLEAFIGGQKIAQSYSQTYQGGSVYALDVAGDDTDTPAQDGGREGDTVTFMVGGLTASETATWHSGTNVELNLTVSSNATAQPPQSTPQPLPTQTAIGASGPNDAPASILGMNGGTLGVLLGGLVVLGAAVLVTWNRRKK